MFRHAFSILRASRLAQAGTALVVLGGLTEALDQLGAVDLTGVPFIGSYAPAILATAGVLKIILRLAMFLLTGLSVKAPAEEDHAA
jgi:hypothetical protein